MTGGWRKIDPGMVRACVHSGFTAQEAADHCGVTYQSIQKYARELGLEFPKGRRRLHFAKTHNPRADEMAERYRAGETLKQIGDSYGITRERVRQLMKRYHGITWRDGGKHRISEVGKAERAEKRDAECLRKWGCTYEQMLSLRGDPHAAFNRNQAAARRESVTWNLTLWEWWTLWQESGLWDKRGRGADSVWMSRVDKSKPYEVGNIKFATCRELFCRYPRNPSRKRPEHRERKHAESVVRAFICDDCNVIVPRGLSHRKRCPECAAKHNLTRNARIGKSWRARNPDKVKAYYLRKKAERMGETAGRATTV